jgi:hypothetical protein
MDCHLLGVDSAAVEIQVWGFECLRVECMLIPTLKIIRPHLMTYFI